MNTENLQRFAQNKNSIAIDKLLIKYYWLYQKKKLYDDYTSPNDLAKCSGFMLLFSEYVTLQFVASESEFSSVF